jgi:hypothetical protein
MTVGQGVIYYELQLGGQKPQITRKSENAGRACKLWVMEGGKKL